MLDPPKYVAVNVPRALVERVDELIGQGTTHYTSRAEFFRDAAARRLDELQLARSPPQAVDSDEPDVNQAATP